jgi:hypothetical protein
MWDLKGWRGWNWPIFTVIAGLALVFLSGFLYLPREATIVRPVLSTFLLVIAALIVGEYARIRKRKFIDFLAKGLLYACVFFLCVTPTAYFLGPEAWAWYFRVLRELPRLLVFGVVVWAVYAIIFVVHLKRGRFSFREKMVLTIYPLLMGVTGVWMAQGLVLKLAYGVVGLSPEVFTWFWWKLDRDGISGVYSPALYWPWGWKKEIKETER